MSDKSPITSESSISGNIYSKGESTDLDVSMLLHILVGSIIHRFNLTDADMDEFDAVVSQYDSYYSALLDRIKENQNIPAVSYTHLTLPTNREV